MDQLIQTFAQYPAVYYVTVALFALAIGSFLNVVIYRLPVIMERDWRKEFAEYFNKPEVLEESDSQPFNLAKPDSRCPKCQSAIKWHDNIPVLGWLMLGGKCRNCGVSISKRYPIIEALTAALAVVVAHHFGVSMLALWALLFTFVMVALTFIDIDKMLLPDQLVLPMIWAGLLINVGGGFTDLNSALLGAVFGYLSLWSVYWLFKLLTGKEGMGYGDFKLLAMIGAWLGWQQLPMTILLSSVVGAVIGISMMVVRGKDKNIPIPFGPYLAIAGWIAMLWGTDISNWYLSTIAG